MKRKAVALVLVLLILLVACAFALVTCKVDVSGEHAAGVTPVEQGAGELAEAMK